MGSKSHVKVLLTAPFLLKYSSFKRMYRLMSLRWIVAVIIDGILKMIFDFTLSKRKNNRRSVLPSKVYS
jgi:hypothetical protein